MTTPRTADRWRQIEEIYRDASARAPDERDAFLAEACGADESLLGEMRSLLDHGEADDGWLNHGPALPSITGAPLRQGARIGVYEVRGLLGAGGMGEVHRAYDTRLGREVAIKVLRRQRCSPPEACVRFQDGRSRRCDS